MVRAAASGVIDYTQADPDDVNWRIRHTLLLRETRRLDDMQFTTALQRHWCGYIGHGRLTEESYANVSKYAGETLDDYRALLYPWPKTPQKAAQASTTQEEQRAPEVTIDDETQKLIAAYKTRFSDEAK